VSNDNIIRKAEQHEQPAWLRVLPDSLFHVEGGLRSFTDELRIELGNAVGCEATAHIQYEAGFVAGWSAAVERQAESVLKAEGR
jgi:hypothetical protein